VAWNGTETAMQGFISDTGITFDNISDGGGVIFERFGVPYQPAWAFVARDGTTTVRIGVLSEEELTKEFNRLATS